MRIQVLMLHQDDPKKNTAAKLVKFGLAKSVRKTFKKTMVLNPFAEKFVLHSDKKLVNSITGIDCSWNLANKTFTKKFQGVQRKLPPLLAGNPMNYASTYNYAKKAIYSKLNKLTTAEAIAGAVYVMGFEDLALDLLNKFKWGHTFFDLNKDLLEDYSKTNSQEEVISIAKDYQILV
ncbi:MAG: DUF367 family protein [Nitrosopumilaceae archaeon]